MFGSLLVRQFIRHGPFDDSSPIGPSLFLILAFPDRHFIGLSLDVFDTFVSPSVF